MIQTIQFLISDTIDISQLSIELKCETKVFFVALLMTNPSTLNNSQL